MEAESLYNELGFYCITQVDITVVCVAYIQYNTSDSKIIHVAPKTKGI